MANVKTVSFGAAPGDYQVQQAELQRRQQLADLLRKQAIDPIEQQTVSGRVVPISPWQGLSKIGQALLAGREQQDVTQQQNQLAERSKQDLVDGLMNYQRTAQGSPAETSQIVDDEYGPQMINAPAVPGNKQAALIELLKSNHPTLQQLGVSEMTKKAETPFGKIDPKDYTQDSVLKFSQTQNFADLAPVRKMEFVNDQAVNPFDVKPGTVVPKKANPFSDLLVPDGSGGVTQNTPLIQAKKDIAKSGKTDVNLAVNTEKGFLGEVAKGVGNAVETSMNQAKSAVGTINSLNQIRSAIDSGKIITGPGADTKILLKQIGVSLGVGGKDDGEILANTRSAMQGMASQELNAAEAMKGQGQITENERALIKRAASGDITMTAPEIKQLTTAIEKTARYRIRSHADNVKRLAQNPNAAPVVDFMRVDEPPAYAPTNAPSIRKYNPATGRIE